MKRTHGTTVQDNRRVSFHVIVDLGFPMNNDLLTNCLDAIENVFTWTATLKFKLVMNGVSVVSSSVHHVFKRKFGDDGYLSRGYRVEDLRTYIKFHPKVEFEEFMDALHLAIEEILLNFRQIPEPEPGCCQLHITLLSRRDGKILQHSLSNIYSSPSIQDVHSFQVVELQDALVEGFPLSDSPGSKVRLARAQIGGLPRLETVLQRVWLSVMRTHSDTSPMQLLLPSPHSVPSTQALECVLTACLLDPFRLPSWLPAWDRFLLTTASPMAMVPLDHAGAAGAKRRVRLRVVSRLTGDGICEASLFGLPLRVTAAPPPGDLDQLQRNAAMFGTLCDRMLARDEYLIVKLQQGDSDDLGGHFVLMPGDASCLLLKSIASAELMLPGPSGFALGEERCIYEAQLDGLLDAVPSIQTYRAEDFPSGLYRALTLNARFPSHMAPLQAARRPQEAAPARHVPEQPSRSPPSLRRDPAPHCVDSPSPSSGRASTSRDISTTTDGAGASPLADDADVAPISDAAERSGCSGSRLRLGTASHPALDADFQRNKPTKRRKPRQPLVFNQAAYVGLRRRV